MSYERLLKRRLSLGAWVPAVGATLVVFLYLAIGIAMELGPVDDAFITYRHSDNFAAGEGLVFNPGEKVEATSNFVFAILLGTLRFLGDIEPGSAALVLNFLSVWFIAFWLIQEGYRRFKGDPADFSYWFSGFIFFFFLPSSFYYVWAGLETSLFSSLIFGGCILFLRSAPKPAGVCLAGVVWAIAASTRMEGLIVLPVALLALQYRFSKTKAIGAGLFALGGFVSIFGPVLLWRWHYYGFLLPNTYYAKIYGGNMMLHLRGLKYVIGFLSMYIGITGVLVFGIIRLFKPHANHFRIVFLVPLLLAQIAGVIYVGGDYFPFYRFFVPSMPIVALLFVELIVTRASNTSTEMHKIPYVIVFLFALFNGAIAVQNKAHMSKAVYQQIEVVTRTEVGHLLRRNVPENATLLLAAAGAIPYYSKLKSHDFFGLTDPVLAHKDLPIGGKLPGHEKTNLMGQIRRLKPDVVMFSSWKVGSKGPKNPRRRLLRVVQVFKRLGQRGGPLSGYFPMYAAAGDLVALCAVKKEIEPHLGDAFQLLKPHHVANSSNPSL
ncbi:MAG: hypothetical protein GY847_16995 [Proteobacteria bacterium]|nr:hypothetical protein [Pseudomonadota bacterium]